MVHLIRVEYIHFLCKNEIKHVTVVNKSKCCMLPNSSLVLYCQTCIKKKCSVFSGSHMV